MSLRRWAGAALGAVAYGFAIGLVHSPKFALRNVVKLPALMLVTALVCAVCYWVLARAIASSLDFRAIARAASEIFLDLGVLLSSLSPVMLFLALTLRRPDDASLGEYPLFLAIHVACVGLCGAIALWHQTLGLCRRHAIGRLRASVLTTAWLAVSLFVGAQASWYMRPFCGVSTVDAPFMLSSEPDFRGARSFYQALFHLIDPPPR